MIVADPTHTGVTLPLRLRWVCPVPTCRHPRAEPERVELTYHRATGQVAARLTVDRWPPCPHCGHLDLIADVIAEAHTTTTTTDIDTTIPTPRKAPT